MAIRGIEDCTTCKHEPKEERTANKGFTVRRFKGVPCNDCHFVKVKTKWEKK